MKSIEFFGTIFVGIVLCYVGALLIGTYIRQVAGHRFRSLVVSLPKSSFLGNIYSMLNTSISGTCYTITLMISSWITSDLLALKQGIRMLAWGNVAVLFYTLIAFFDFKFAIVIGAFVVGALYYLNSKVKAHSLLGVLLGIALLYFGSSVILENANNIKQLYWFNSDLLNSRNTILFIFALGAIAKFFVEPTFVLLIVGIAFSQEGLFPIVTSLWFLLGIFTGAGIRAWKFSQEVYDSSRLVASTQVLYYIILICVFLPFLALDSFLGLPFLSAILSFLPSEPHIQFFLFTIMSALITSAIFQFSVTIIKNILEHSFTVLSEHEEAAIRYIHKTALNDPESGMDLIEKEQFRLIRRFPQYMEVMRSRDLMIISPQIKKLHTDFESVANAIQEFINDLSSKDLSHESLERQMNLMHRNNTLIATEKKIFHKCEDISHLFPNRNIHDLLMKFVEALDVILYMMNDAVDSLHSSDIELLHTVTYDRDKQMQEIRKHYLSQENALSIEERSKLLEIIVTFEKCVWLARQLSNLLKNSELFDLNP